MACHASGGPHHIVSLSRRPFDKVCLGVRLDRDCGAAGLKAAMLHVIFTFCMLTSLTEMCHLQAAELPDQQQQPQEQQPLGGEQLSSQQAAALAAFCGVPSQQGRGGGAADSTHAGAEIAAIMLRPPAMDPTTLDPATLAAPQQHIGSGSNLQQLGSSSRLQQGSSDNLEGAPALITRTAYSPLRVYCNPHQLALAQSGL